MSDHFRIDEEGGKHEPIEPKPELGMCERGKYDPSHSAVSHVKNRNCDGWQLLASPQERCPNCGELKSDPTDECIHKFHNHVTPSASAGGRDDVAERAAMEISNLIFEARDEFYSGNRKSGIIAIIRRAIEESTR